MQTAVGWRDREYAKWTDEERNRFLGSGMPNLSHPSRARGGLIRPGAGLAILVTAVLLALGHFPTSHPIAPTLRFRIPGLSEAPPPIRTSGTIEGLTSAALGSTLSLRGAAPKGNGPVTVEGSYDGGRTWQTLSTVDSNDGGYAAQVSLNRRGTLEIRIVFADGSQATGSVTVS